MLEVYVILAMGSLGYIMNSMGNQIKPKKQTINRFETPSMKNVYESTNVEKAKQTERQLAERAYRDALAPRKTNRVMTMAGEMVDETEFKHNNMEPYFGGRVRQNTEVDQNRTVLENFTGVSDIKKQKCEVKSFYDRSEHLGNVYGMANQDAFYRDRIEQPRARKNELPMDQVRVGPGLNLEYGENPVGGFQQYEAGEIARRAEKCVDQLRVKNNPKESFEARTVDGVKAKLAGLEGNVAKNRVDRYYEQGEDRWFKTTGANLKQTMTSKFNVKPTHRLSTTKYYGGTARGRDARTLEARVEASARQQFGADGMRNAVLSAFGLGQKNDYGKANVVVYQNERDLTTTRTYQGNLTSLIKAVVAPLQDLIKNTKKQESVDNPRHFGSIAPQMPEKAAIHDPNDIARATLKEQLIDAVDPANLRGPKKLTVHDPDDTARATLKEQLIDAVDPANLRGPEKLTVHDPDDTARATLKEQLIHDSIVGNMKPARPDQLTVYDPTDTARTTLKEVGLHDEIGTGALTGPKEIYVYDPDEIAKRTIRETLRDVDYSANVASAFKHSKLHFDDEARATIKQTTQDNLYDAGPNALEGAGGYEVTDYEAPATQKEFLSDRDYIGGAARDLGEGYQTNEHEAKTTQKALLSDNDYYGVGEGANKKQKSYDLYDNAHVDERKEATLFGREPTSQGAKKFNDCVNVRIKKTEDSCKAERALPNMDRVYQTGPQLSDRQITKQRLAVDLDSRLGLDRIDPDLLKAFRENEYTQPLDSAI